MSETYHQCFILQSQFQLSHFPRYCMRDAMPTYIRKWRENSLEGSADIGTAIILTFIYLGVILFNE